MSLQFAPYHPRGPGDDALPAPDGLTIRPARAADAEGLARVIAERQGGDLGQHRGRVTAELEQLERRAGPAERLLLVAEVGGDVVGFGRAGYFAPAADAPANAAPEGWYLLGVIVAARARRRGIGAELTRRRMDWLADRGVSRVFYFANARNRATLDLHAKFGFRELTRDFTFPAAVFEGGVGVLSVADLPAAAR